MIAETPNIAPAIQAVRQYREEHAAELSQAQSETLMEVGRRLERLSAQAEELIEINNRLWAKEGFDVSFDPTSDTMVIKVGGIEQRLKLNRADPNVPITMSGQTAGGAYHAGKAKPSDEEEQALRLDLEEKLESYYQSAHRVLKLLAKVPMLPEVRSAPITRVRNNLVEHPADGALYSFGFGSSGPRVKPMHQGTPSYVDDGLVPNTRDFVDSIVRACTRDD